MTKLILIVFVMSMQLIGAQDKPDIEIKAKQNNEIVTVALIKSPMYAREESKKRAQKPAFITHISAEMNKETVFEVRTSANIAKYPRFKFKYKNISNADKLEVLITNNESLQRKKEFQIGEQSEITDARVFSETRLLKTDNTKINPKVFEATTVNQAIQELYGSVINPIEEKINIEMPKVTANSRAIPIKISSDVDLESMAVFADKIHDSTIAVFSIPHVAIIDYDIMIKVIEPNVYSYSITVIGKGRDGKFYKTVKKGEIYYSGEGCG